MYISLYDLGLVILFFIAVTVSAYLIAVLRRAFCVLGHVQGILADHDQDISETLSLLPEALANVNELTASLKETAEQTSGAIAVLQDNVVEDLREGLETFTVYAKVIADVFRAIFTKSG
ncbi:MAG: hypothetical protein P4N41_02510 [Negativicutes bacterium]|nr:hypothetical protein [Negativicutes bacterium]